MSPKASRLKWQEDETHCWGRQLGLLPLLVEEARELVTALEHIAAGLIEGAAVVPDKADVVSHRTGACVEIALQTLGDRSQVHWILRVACQGTCEIVMCISMQGVRLQLGLLQDWAERQIEFL